MGSNCALVNCPAKRTINRGLSFFKVPKKGVNDEWRSQLLQKIGRADKGFNPDTANICSRHFLQSCFHTTPKGHMRLTPGSLPTLCMPVKSVETPQPQPRKLPRSRNLVTCECELVCPFGFPTPYSESIASFTPLSVRRQPPPEVLRVNYFTLEDVRKDASQLPHPWLLLEDGEQKITFGTVDDFAVKIHVSVSADLTTTITGFGIAGPHLTGNLETVRLKEYLLQLSALQLCTGVTGEKLQQFPSLPSQANASQKHFLHVTYRTIDAVLCHQSSVRSRECSLLSPTELCNNCKNTKRSLLLRHRRKQLSQNKPLHVNEPLQAASKQKLKEALMDIRKREKRLQEELEAFKAKLGNDAVEVDEKLHEGIKSILDNAPTEPLVKLFWEEQCKAFGTRGERGMKWHPMMIRLALLLHSKSSCAYKTLRETGILRLPGESTLRDYTNFVHPKTGFQPELLTDLKAAANKLHDNQKFVVLLHDEMSIKEDLVFDKRSGDVVGFVNLDSWGGNKNRSAVASHVLVFYVVGINSSLKSSLGFFATRTATADEIYPIFWRAVGFLEDTCGLKVIASTSDIGSPNQRLYQLHGADNEVCYKTINFHAPEREIIFFSDPPHLVKTARNNLFRSGFGNHKSSLLWNRGKDLIWQHVCEAYAKDKSGPLRKTKLTNDHINLTSHSTMSVRLAAQVLSRSVGLVMQSYGSEECQETAKFILYMDRCFDCLNGRSASEAAEKKKPDLRPYTHKDDPRFEFFDEFLTYLNEWKASVLTRQGNFTQIEKSKMFLTHQTFKGLVMTIKSFKEVVPFLLDTGVDFVLSNKFCQDPLEAHFGRHRGFGQRSDNPTLHVFGYQENKIRLQRSLAMIITPKGNVEKKKRKNEPVVISTSPLKKRKL